MTEKLCSACGLIKPATEFYKNRKRKCGLTSKCKLCFSAYNKRYWQTNAERLRPSNRERVALWRADPINAQRSKEWHAEHWPERREKENARRRQRALDNPEAERLAAANYYQRTREERKAAVKAYKAANLDAVLTNVRNRKAMKRNAQGVHTAAELEALLIEQHSQCANPYCLADLSASKKHVDHIVALSNGGSNDISNLQWLCEPCNLTKRAKPQDLWLKAEAAKRAARLK